MLWEFLSRLLFTFIVYQDTYQCQSVSWSCKHQFTVTTSFTETEYIDQYNAAQKAIWIQFFLKELNSFYQNLIKKSTIIKQQKSYLWIWHFTSESSVWMLFITDSNSRLNRRYFEFKDISSKENEADSLSKLPSPQLYRMFKNLIHMNEI